MTEANCYVSGKPRKFGLRLEITLCIVSKMGMGGLLEKNRGFPWVIPDFPKSFHEISIEVWGTVEAKCGNLPQFSFTGLPQGLASPLPQG